MDVTFNYHKGADTSNIAYSSTPSSIRSNHKIMILETIYDLGDATCDEIEKCLNLNHQSASARITELKVEGKIYDTGTRRLTKSGKPARVYAITK